MYVYVEGLENGGGSFIRQVNITHQQCRATAAAAATAIHHQRRSLQTPELRT